MEQREKLAEAVDRARMFDEMKEDFLVPMRDLRFSNNGNGVLTLNVPESSSDWMLNDWSQMQMAGRLGQILWPSIKNHQSTKPIPMDYVANFPVDMQADQLNWVMDQTDKSALIRGFGGMIVRAWLSDQYGIFDNSEFLEPLWEILKDHDTQYKGFRTLRNTVTPDHLHLKIVWESYERKNGSADAFIPDPDETRGYGLGVAIGNDEIGAGGLWIQPLLWTHACTNSIVAKGQGWRHIHRGDVGGRVNAVLMKAQMLDAFKASYKLLDRMMLAEEQRLPSFGDVARGMAKELGWNSTVTDNLLVGSGGDETVAGLVNGLTFAAHRMYGPGPDGFGGNPSEQHRLEELAGVILEAPYRLDDRNNLFVVAARRGQEVRVR